MKTRFYFSVLAFAMMAAACDGKKEGTGTAVNTANLDRSISPKEDFYRYATGGWQKAHPLTDEYGRFGTFDQLAETNLARIKGLIEGLAAGESEEGSIAAKIGTLYRMAMDSASLNRDGVAPLKAQMDRIAAVGRKGMEELVGLMNREGMHVYFGCYVGPDAKNSSMNLLEIGQGGLGLGDRDYYLGEDTHNREIREKYLLHMERMFGLAGWEGSAAKRSAEGVMKLELRLAKASSDKVSLRDPHANYHKMDLEELKKTVPGFDWALYFKALGAGAVQEVDLGQPAALKEVADILNTADMEDQKAYLYWKLLCAAAPYLDDALAAENFAFYGRTLSGVKEMKPRWKRALSAVDGAMSEAVGQMYVEKYFPAEAKERMIRLVANLQKALGERIRALTWMSGATKAKALEKLAAIYVKVGYPDTWRDYSALDIRKDSYWGNIVRSSVFEQDHMFSKLGKPVDRTEWLMSPQTINAYYNPSTNEICFPAAILQYPFFDMKADDAANYGGIGVVIGHEMTHGFDDQGRQYDKDGNLRDWWTAEDARNFEERAKVLVDFFNGIEVLPGLNANGQLTLGENIADFGGLQIAFQAFHNATREHPLGTVGGFTADQRFYLSYASLWAANIRDEQIRRLTQMDVHALGRWRVNATLRHIGSWHETFGVKEGDAMWLAPDKRASIW